MTAPAVTAQSSLLGLFGTSAAGSMIAHARGLVIYVAGSLGVQGATTAELRQNVEQVSPANEHTSSGAVAAEMPSSGKSILELRRITGLTWEQLATLFGVARRSLHFWASGNALNADNEDRLNRILATLRRIDRGNARENRTALMAVQEDGIIPLDLLASGRYDEVVERLGQGPKRHRLVLTQLSPEAHQARTPAKPEVLTGALQGTVHRDTGKARAVRAARVKRKP